MKRILFYLLFILIISGCAHRQNIKDIPGQRMQKERIETVRAEGMSAIVNNDLLEAKKKALAEAQKNAVEMTVGVYVNAATRVEKAIMVDQQILAKTNGYIKKYKILSEGQQGEFYKTTIEAQVKIEDINKDLSLLGLNAPPAPTASTLRIALSIQESVDTITTDRETSENILAEKLLSFQYKVIDQRDFTQAARNLHITDLYNNMEQQKKIGSFLNADILILGQADSTFNTDQGLGGLTSYRATLSFRVVKVKEAALLYANSVSSGGVSTTKSDAAQEALKRSASVAAGELLKVLEQRLNAFNYLTLTVQNIPTLNQLHDIMNGLRGMVEVKYAQTSSFQSGIAIIKIGADPSLVSAIAKKLENISVNSSSKITMQVTETGTDYIEAKMVQ